MIVVIGGAFQGKLKFAMELLGNPEGERTAEVADGGKSPYCHALEKPVVYGLHRYVRRLLEEGKSPEQFIGGLIQNNPEAVVITDEVGCGIVPMDESERAFREAAGRAVTKLASSAGSVYRVVCGIGIRIK